MSNRAIISTPAAPEALGPYSQGIKVGNTVWLSGQIPLIPGSMELVTGAIGDQATQVFKNLAAICQAANGSLSDCVKLTIYLTDLGNFAEVNEVMASFFETPYPARAAIEVSALPKGVSIEIDAIMSLG